MKRGGRYEKRGEWGKLGGLEGEVRLKAVNVFMEKRELSTWLNQEGVGHFMGEDSSYGSCKGYCFNLLPKVGYFFSKS